jgi:hypothetical protein
MPVHQEVDAARGRVIAKVYGEVTLEQMIATIDASVRDPAFRPGFDVLSDHLGIEKVITTQQLKGVVNHLRSLSQYMSGSRWAIVTRDPASYGMMRMLSVYAEEIPMDVRVFKSMDQAEEWLSSPKG